MSKIGQRGFGLIGVFLVVLVLCGIGGSSYYVWYRHYKSSSQHTAQKASNQKHETSSKIAKTQVGPQQPKYLVIKEWGVELPLSANIKDAYYEFRQGNPRTAYLALHSLTDISPNCAPDKISEGAIFRNSEAEQQAILKNGPGEDNPSGSIKVGNYYYGYLHAQAACTDDPQGMQAELRLQPNQAFNTALKGLKEVSE